MSWRDRYQAGSFRGVPIFVDSASRTFGRRVALHEYPGRDIPYGEDLGRKARTYSINGYLIGDDYDQARETLISAIETAGEAVFVDPYRGSSNVLCTGFSVSESKDEGNICKFTLELIEVGQKKYPSQSVSPLNNVAGKGASIIRTAKNKFASKYTLEGLPGFVQESTAAVMKTFSGAFKTIVTVSGEFQRALDNIDEAAGDIVQVYDTVITAIETPFSLLSKVGSIKERNNILRLLSRFSEGLPTINELTATRSAEANAHLQIGRLVDSFAVAAGAELAAGQTYKTIQDAQAEADYWADTIDDFSENEDDPDIYSAYSDMRAAIVLALPPPGQRLPDIKTIELSTVQPSLVTAYRLYGNALRGDEITERNNIPNPAFLPAAEPLEVLSE